MSARLSSKASDTLSLGKRTDFDSVTWRFPDTNQCPLKQCLLSCSGRGDALNHFRMHHADITMLCSICGELILAENPQNFLRHYKNVHPNEPQPELKKAASSGLSIEKDESRRSSADCWNCGKNKANIRCSKCKHWFHKKCAKNHSEANWICDECKEVHFKPSDVKFIPYILKYVEEKFTSLANLQFSSEQTQNGIGIQQMKQKPYETVEQFEDDIKCFRYNCRINYADDNEVQAPLKRLIGFVKKQIEDIQVCGECYENECKFGENSLAMTCSQPHLLLWSQRQIDCYLPAKVMAVNVKQNEAAVQFFDDKTMELMSVSSSYLYSKEYPMKKLEYPMRYDKVIKAANEYTENIRSKFGHYNFARRGAKFHPEKLAEYLKQMIAEKPSTDFDGSAFSASGADANPKVPKRSASRSSVAKAVPVKKIRDQNGMDASRSDASSAIGQTEVQASTSDYLPEDKLRIDEASDGIAHGLQIYNQIFCDNAKEIKQLRTDLDKSNKKTRDLEQKDATIAEAKKELERMVGELKQKMSDEKKASEERYAALVGAKNEEKNAFENVKKDLLEKIGALEMKVDKSDGEKKAFEQKIEELESFRNQIYQMAKPPK